MTSNWIYYPSKQFPNVFMVLITSLKVFSNVAWCSICKLWLHLVLNRRKSRVCLRAWNPCDWQVTTTACPLVLSPKSGGFFLGFPNLMWTSSPKIIITYKWMLFCSDVTVIQTCYCCAGWLEESDNSPLGWTLSVVGLHQDQFHCALTGLGTGGYTGWCGHCGNWNRSRPQYLMEPCWTLVSLPAVAGKCRQVMHSRIHHWRNNPQSLLPVAVAPHLTGLLWMHPK